MLPNISLRVEGQGIPLVLFHGFGFDLRIWSSLIPLLQTEYQLFFVDLPGFGKTPLMDWISFKTALLKVLPEQFSILGWSMGGLWATQLALEASDRVSNLMNLASTPFFIREAQWPGIDRAVFRTFHDNLSLNPAQTLNQFLNLQGSSAQISEGSLTKEGLAAGLELLLTCDLRPSLNALTMPVGYLFGRLDAIVPFKTLSMMQKLYPHLQYWRIDRAAHAPFLSHPIEFVSILKAFIQ